MDGAIMSVQPNEFKVDDPSIFNGLVVEASAGSGKTFSVAGMVTLQLALREDLRVADILVTTFTRNAAAELRDRIRRQLVSLEKALRLNSVKADDAVGQVLLSGDRLTYAGRLDRAIREFDTATIATMHSVCSKVLAMAGLVVAGEGRSGVEIDELIASEVNSAIISHFSASELSKVANIEQFQKRLLSVVKEVLRSPQSLLTADGLLDESGDSSATTTGRKARYIINLVATRVKQLTRDEPTFDDLLVRTAELLGPKGDAAVAEAFRSRFKLAVIDEAQDTNELQWDIFRSVFRADETSRTLVAVGDPKQAIYRFRGADVEAYLAQRDPAKVRTLTRNWRSDARLVRALNCVFSGKSFGVGINYPPVVARDGAPESSISKFPSLAILKVGEQTNARSVVSPAARRVRQLLEELRITDGDKDREVRPEDICVLVRSRASGRRIESALRAMNVPAVSSGTESVMNGAMASDLRRVLKAISQLGDESSARLAAATVFLGAELSEVGSISDENLQAINQKLFDWSGVLRRKGISALAFEFRKDAEVMNRIVSGRDGERRETDLAHLVELLHVETNGKGCTAEDVVAAFDMLAEVDAMAETVSRRVESDRDAVQIMTVHSAKGLEFPVVVVADLWKLNKPASSTSAPSFHTEVDHEGVVKKRRLVDVNWVHGDADKSIVASAKDELNDEEKRLFYVAMTRAKHHVSLVHAVAKEVEDGKKQSDFRVTSELLNDVSVEKDTSCIKVLNYTNPPVFPDYTMPDVDTENNMLAVAPLTRQVTQTYKRLSFSGITKHHRGQSLSPIDTRESTGGGDGDDDQIITIQSGYADVSLDLGVDHMPLARLRGGTYFGKVMHKVYELIDVSSSDLPAEVASVVKKTVIGSMAQHRDEIVEGVLLSLQTPLGGPLGNVCLADIPTADRLAEMSFEMGLAGSSAQVSVSDLGALTASLLREAGRGDDILLPYFDGLAQSFKTQLVGLMNGSIDALLRVPCADQHQYFITDYKTNRLDREGVSAVIDGYERESMCTEMIHHDYPLQALIYGISVYRFLRWAQPSIDPDDAIAGLAYFFVRGMVGDSTPLVGQHRHGVFTWEAPKGLWSAASDLFSGVKS
jgi:exodeoxyribonuclease V beta subunit